MQRLLSITLLASGLISTTQAAVLDFDQILTPEPHFNTVGNPYLEDGFQISHDCSVCTGVLTVLGSEDGGYTGVNSVAPFWAGGLVYSIQRIDGGPFSALSIDLGEFRNWAAYLSPNVESVNFTGQKAGGGTVGQEFMRDGIWGLETFYFSGFENLTSIEFMVPATASGYQFQFDNLILNSAPIPSDSDSDSDSDSGSDSDSDSDSS